MLVALLLACTPAPAPPADVPGPVACAEGELLDGTTCVPAACGAGPWGDVEADVYADGSTSLAALVAAHPNARIALAAGEWDAALQLDRTNDGLTLIGRCPELVTLIGADTPIVALAGRATATLQSLTLRGGVNTLEVTRGDLVVEDVDIRTAGAFGILASGASITLQLTDVSITDTQPVDGRFGRGIDVEYGVVLTADGLELARNVDVSLYAVGDVVLDLHAVHIADSLPAGPDVGGRGIEVGLGTTLTASDVLVERATDVGVYAYGVGTTVDLDTTTILDTSATDTRVGAAGIQVTDGARLTLTHSTVARTDGPGIVADGANTALTVEDSTIDENQSTNGAVDGGGLAVQNGAHATIRRSTLNDNTAVALGSTDPGSELVVEDVQVRGTRVGTGVHGGEALFADGGTLTATSVEVSDGQENAVYARAGAVVDLEGLTVDGTWTTAEADYGRGINVQEAATLTCVACTLADSHDVGVLADGYGTRVTLVDTIIRDTRTASVTRGGIGVDVQAQAVVIGEGLTIEGTDGPGVYVVTQGEFACDRCALTGNGFAGVVVLDGGVTLVDGAVDGSRGDASSGGGVGIYASGHYGPTSLSLDGVSLVGNRYAAVWLDGDGEYRLESSTLEGGAGVSFGSAILHGNAVFATGGVTAGDGTQGLSLAGSTLSGCRTAVLLHGASAALAGTVFTGNALDLQQQACATVDLPTGLEAAASSAICPDRWQLVAPLSYGLYLQDVSADR